MAPLDSLIVDELELLDRVTAGLAALPADRTPSETPILRELSRLREVMLSREEDKDLSSLREQWHHQSSLLRQLRDARGAAAVDPSSPYFGHLRLREGDRVLDLCLGRASCVQKGLRIVDWRDAPISRVFYSYRQGEEYDEEIAGRERIGLVEVRRMVRISEGALERIQAPEGDFVADPDATGGWTRRAETSPQLAGGEAVAVRAYGPDQGEDARLGRGRRGELRPADKRLPEITGLIDPDQFELITRSREGFLVIRGAAGSGKTTVALHRVAYLAYEDEKIDSPQTLIAVFSEALRSYVGHVLPSLGLTNVAIVAYQEWLSDQRRRHFPELNRVQRRETPAWIQRFKLHPVMAAALEAQVARQPGPATPEQAFDDWASAITQEPLLREACERMVPGVFSASDLRRVARDGRDLVDRVSAALAGEREVAAELDGEDDALLLRAWQLRVGALRGPGKRPLRYRHVVLDEVQDFSPLEVQILLDCLTPGASITLAGDTQQHLSENSGFTSWSEFFGHVGIEGREIETLRVNYRSSREIARFAFSLLGDLQEDAELPRSPREGPPVEVFRFSDRGACVFFLSEALRELGEREPLASVAVLTPSTSASALYFDGLERSDLPRVRRVEYQDFSFAAGIEVTEIEQVKGLEFDYVILVDVDAEQFPDKPAARRRLHVAATRAVHQLWVTSVGTPSVLLSTIEGA